MPNEFFDSSIFQVGVEDWKNILPYLVLSFAVAITTLAAAGGCKDKTLKVLSLTSFFTAAALFFIQANDPARAFIGSSMMVGPFERLSGGVVCVFAFLAALYARSPNYRAHSEWAALLVICAFGAALLPTARNWIAFFVYLEMLSIPAYLLSALHSNREKCLEAAMKYLMMGAFVSAFFLLGITLFYGVTSSFSFDAIAAALPNLSPTQQILCFSGAVLVFSAMAFKVSLFPFHMWAADVYQGAPASVAGFLAGATKLSVFMALAISFHACSFWEIPGLSLVATALGMMSIVLGALLAISQSHFRRMLAYSGVVNAGFVSLALPQGLTVLPEIFAFLVIYGLSVAGAFAAFSAAMRVLERDEDADQEIQAFMEFKGLVSPLLLLGLVFSLLSLTGIPPLPGFFSKYLLISTLVERGEYLSLAVALMGTLLGLAFYLRGLVPLCLYPSLSKGGGPKALAIGGTLSSLLAVGLAIALVVGFKFFHYVMESAALLAK